MLIAGLVFAGIAALIHVYIFVLESVLWTRPRTRAVFGVRSEADAAIMRPLAFNQGFYNLFLAVVTVAGIVCCAAGATVVGAALVLTGTGSMLAAGIVLLCSGKGRVRPALVQLVPALLAILLVSLGLAF